MLQLLVAQKLQNATLKVAFCNFRKLAFIVTTVKSRTKKLHSATVDSRFRKLLQLFDGGTLGGPGAACVARPQAHPGRDCNPPNPNPGSIGRLKRTLGNMDPAIPVTKLIANPPACSRWLPRVEAIQKWKSPHSARCRESLCEGGARGCVQMPLRCF